VNMHCIAIIPARGGSKRIYKKNIRPLLGKPLVTYSIEQALAARHIDRVYVSTEDKEIASIASRGGAEIINRPAKLATDTASTEDVIFDALRQLKLQNIEPEYVVLLQPTSPLRYPSDIDGAITKILSDGSDSLLSVCRNNRFLWLSDMKALNYDYKKRPRSQEKEWEFIENGSIYITKVETFMKKKNRLAGKISFYEQPNECAFEIDDEFDWKLLEFLIRKYYITQFFKDRLSKIKLFLMDVDGVLTDGGIYYDSSGEQLLKFNRQDGKGIELLRDNGYITGIISAEDSEIAKRRFEKLKIEHIFLKCREKSKALDSILSKVGISEEEVLFIGDDIQDIPIIERVGFSACPSNAVDVVKDRSLYLCKRSGGSGAVREVIDLLLCGSY